MLSPEEALAAALETANSYSADAVDTDTESAIKRYAIAYAYASVEKVPCPLDLPGTRQFVGGAKDIHGNCERAGVPCSSLRCRTLIDLEKQYEEAQ